MSDDLLQRAEMFIQQRNQRKYGVDNTQAHITLKEMAEFATNELKEYREFVGAMQPGTAIFINGDGALLGKDGKWYTGKSGICDSALDAWRNLRELSVESEDA